ncbi:glycosyltransferase family 32 protein [Belliella pelovolcani]|uniref:Glycosyltransferase sugar-binding region containing DXD motif-containing protein n=1 Tax=Belliella pelovolcani TaxID=529505 RepID=A0A1N7KWB8_9BACT|nr:glycosyltransferase [Belliella pelovolcani]SIS65837.1 Glycosyltransferase sugar-binding region containing DXD motif-containing protein [Belliella pelovolcani]
MIPKIIHYCWFGPAKPSALELKCLASWKKYCPDYHIKLWNEDNFDVNYCEFTKEAYRLGKYAFVSDVARLYALQHEGGVYLDTDMLLLKPFPDWLIKSSTVLGKENRISINAAFIAAHQDSIIINDLLNKYKNLKFSKSPPLIPEVLTSLIVRLDEDIKSTCKVLEPDFFYPLPYKLKHLSYRKFITKDTIAVHLWIGSWKNYNRDNFTKIINNFISRFYLPKPIQYYKERFR